MLGAAIGRSGKGETSQHQRGVRRGKEPPLTQCPSQISTHPSSSLAPPFSQRETKASSANEKEEEEEEEKKPCNVEEQSPEEGGRKEGMISSSRLKSAFSSSSSQLVIAKRKLCSSYSFLSLDRSWSCRSCCCCCWSCGGWK